jgi:hypothetical protein
MSHKTCTSLPHGMSVYGPSTQPPLPPKQMDEVVKLRPRVVLQERERLYDDVMKQRMETNALRDENTKCRTRL